MRPVPSGALDENIPHPVHIECSGEDTLNSNSSWRRHTNVLHSKLNCQCLWYYQFGWSWSRWHFEHRSDLQIAVTPNMFW